MSKRDFAEPERLDEFEAVGEALRDRRCTPALAALIDPNDPADPIARQFVPDRARTRSAIPPRRDDPIGDDPQSPVNGLVHRYPDRVLMKLVSVCAVYCRFCFRRETCRPRGGTLTQPSSPPRSTTSRAHPEIWEVVLTGGDPLTLSPRRLAETTQALAAIPHVKVLRWHTRLPVAAPERVTKALARALYRRQNDGGRAARQPSARTDAEARAACRRLIEAGAMLVSQSVFC